MRGVGTVLVVGSINADLVVRTAGPSRSGRDGARRRPRRDMRRQGCEPGGRGGARGCGRRAGRGGGRRRARTRPAGRAARGGRVVDGVAVVRGVATGLAVITVTPDGENSIVVVPGANAQVSAPRRERRCRRRADRNPRSCGGFRRAGRRASSSTSRRWSTSRRGDARGRRPARRECGRGRRARATSRRRRRRPARARPAQRRWSSRSARTVRGCSTDGVDVLVPAPASTRSTRPGAGDVLVGTLAAALARGADLVEAVRTRGRGSSRLGHPARGALIVTVGAWHLRTACATTRRHSPAT